MCTGQRQRCPAPVKQLAVQAGSEFGHGNTPETRGALQVSVMQVTGDNLGSHHRQFSLQKTPATAKVLQALLSIHCHKRQHLREKDLKTDFQVVNVPLITSESVPAVGKKSSSMSLHKIQQEWAGLRTLTHYPDLNPGALVSKGGSTHLNANNCRTSSSEYSLALACLFNYKDLP